MSDVNFTPPSVSGDPGSQDAPEVEPAPAEVEEVPAEPEPEAAPAE